MAVRRPVTTLSRLRPCCAVAAWLLAGNSLAAQQAALERRSGPVTATTSPITIDGVLDEPAWAAAPPIGDLVQRQPVSGAAPTERTVVTLLHDRDQLYIGVVCDDAEPDRVLGSQMARDAALSADDRLEILLDTFRDRRNAFYFATNPSGALVDGLVSNGQLQSEWDAIWEVRTRRTAAGWTAEFAIPFKSLSFPAGREVWGFNISRTIQRKLEEGRWAGARLDLQFNQVSEAGEIGDLTDLTQGIGLDVRPFAAGRWRYGDRQNTADGKPGLDVSYNFTPSLKLTATVNTDFGETEVDARQINLSRFSVLFPEKRSFFLEDAGVFTFASTGPNPPGGIPATGAEVFPFFSRQIGLLAGEEVPLDAGIKLTGKIGRTDIGLLDARTGSLGTVSDKNFFVARARRNILRQSYLGAVYTEGHPALPVSSRTVGADVRLATSRLFGGARNFVFTAYGLRSVTEGSAGRDWSYGASAIYPNDKFNPQIIVRDIQENFRPALGFVQRRGVRLLRVGGGFNPRPTNFLGIQQMFHDVYYTRFTRLDTGAVESWDLYVTLVDWHFNSGDSLHSVSDINPTYERLFTPFAISPGVVLPPGEYRFTRFRYALNTASKRRLQGNVNYSFGRYWSGHGETLTAGISYKAPPRFNISLTSNQTFARLPQGHFTARILTVQGSYSTSPFLSFSNLVQYDNLSRNLGWQSRARWTMKPGNDVFFVVTQGWIQDAPNSDRFRAQDGKVSTKIQYTTRF
jgi:hypothetical protein